VQIGKMVLEQKSEEYKVKISGGCTLPGNIHGTSTSFEEVSIFKDIWVCQNSSPNFLENRKQKC